MLSFSTTGAAAAPVVVTLPVSSSGTSSAVLAGTVNPNGQATAYTFEYGTATSFGSITPVVALDAAIADEPVSATLTGLSPGTTYFYRLIAANATGTSMGVVRSFTTGGGGAPAATTGVATAVTASSATLSATVNPHGSPTSFAFEYGQTTAFGLLSAVDNAGASGSVQPVSLTITGLSPSTTYRYRVVATNAVGTAVGHRAELHDGRRGVNGATGQATHGPRG